MHKLTIKSKKEIEKMRESGKRLAQVRDQLMEKVAVGVSAAQIEELAMSLIKKSGGKASFAMVPGYSWATCINVNEGVVHGIPKQETVFKSEDVVSVDVGLVYDGFHSDTSSSKLLGSDPKKQELLKIGRDSLKAGIAQASSGNLVGDISRAMGEVLEQGGMKAVKSLSGHGIGRELHEDPRVPCTEMGSEDEYVPLREGMTLAIEVMYTDGSGLIKLEKDGWTISTRDGRISALFEETVAVTSRGPIILTR